jgi:hypothetical protein
MEALTTRRSALAALTVAISCVGVMGTCSTTDSMTWYGGAAGEDLCSSLPSRACSRGSAGRCSPWQGP